jgi:hypothetical protein
MIDKSIYLPLMRDKGVMSVGLGKKTVNDYRYGRQCTLTTDTDSLVCSVKEKLDPSMLTQKTMIPKEIDGVPTDVITSKPLQALATLVEPKRPAPGGVSIGHFAITAGTLGCYVTDEDGHKVVLSNNHVMANGNNALIGDAILQPGIADGGIFDEDVFAYLQDFKEIEFGGISDLPTCPIAIAAAKFANFFARNRHHKLAAFKDAPSENHVDCAIALPVNSDWVDDRIMDIGKPVGPITVPTVGLKIQKHGRTTGYTLGEVLQVGVAAQIQYNPGQTAIFVDQIICGPISAGGDSGSLVCDMDKHPVGLLFAGSDEITILNPMDYVLNALNVTFDE